MLETIFPDSVLDASGFYFCVLDLKGTILSINASFARIIGDTSRHSLVGSNAQALANASPETASLFTAILTDITEENVKRTIIHPVHRNSEKTLYIHFEIIFASSAQYGKCICVSGCDISEHINSRQKAEQIEREKNQFLIRMGHELKTPLNTVLGYAQLLHGLDNLSPVAKEYVATIIENENTLLHLLNNIFELTKYESGQTTPVLSRTNTRKLFQENLSAWKELYANKMLSLELEFKGDIPESIETDTDKVNHILSNILANSFKFTRKGGATVTVSYNSLLTVDIEDTGIGMDTTDQNDIFNSIPYSTMPVEQLSGTGLGLAVARIFSRMLGGDAVLVRSSPDNGSHFRITLKATPILAEKTNKITVSDYASITGISKPCKVLLVDDVDINLAMLEIFLAPAGFSVCIASDGNEAVEKYKSFQPDIVFMDLIMPEKDGFEATREIKEIAPSIPVIALTASIADKVKEQALEAGVSGFMSKPFVPERFFEIIADHTGVEYLYT